MLTDKFLVIVWHQRNGSVIPEERWSGENFDEALIIGAYEFCKEIISVECKEKKVKPKPKTKVDMSYSNKLKCRITVTRDIDPRFKTKGNSPKILRTFGNEMIKIPKF